MTPGIDELRELGTHLDDLPDAAGELLGTEGVEALASFLAEVRGIRQALGKREQEIEDLLVDVMCEDTITITGVGSFTLRHGKDRKAFDSEELLRLVIRKALDPDETGELPQSIPEVVEAIFTEVYAAAPITPSMQWRVTRLKELGIDPDEWCTATPKRATVQITEVAS